MNPTLEEPSTLFKRECQCGFEYYRVSSQEYRPPQPRLEQHRPGANDGGCHLSIVKMEWEGRGGRGAWKSYCPGVPYLHALPAAGH